MKTNMHMICNAHLDPVWQWEWEEGAAAAISTFRAAADFCEEYDGFVFNHNEALLYEWVEEYEPKLFKRIEKLIKAGKWHVMGGWYLQPDCVMPSGESFVRQILLGLNYFNEKFGVRPTTAINLDSFGHTRGLVQILAKAGYDSYLFMRPTQKEYEIGQGVDFIWQGFDGSEIMCHKILPGYNSALGQVQRKINECCEHFSGKEIGLMAWGVGNHGGGPSRMDLNTIAEFQQTDSQFNLIHSTPEGYFEKLRKSGKDLPNIKKSIVPCFVGCYTSQIRIKQKHRELENLLYMTEKMAATASMQGLMEYPQEELKLAQKDLAIAEFHDVLPGSSVQPVEEYALNLMGHGMSILSKIRAKAFFALSSGQRKAEKGEYPIFVYNPHPFAVKGIFECEFMLEDQNWSDEFAYPIIYDGELKIPSQPEHENSSINLDWRKKVVFEAELKPSCINRFDCRITKTEKRKHSELQVENGRYILENDTLLIEINEKTGLVDKFSIDGQNLLKNNTFKPIILADTPDSWRMDTDKFEHIIGCFDLMTSEEGAAFCGIDTPASIRIVEDGAVRIVIEAYFKYHDSFLCITYKFPKKGTEFEVQVRVYWNEKDKMLKLSVPTRITDGKYIGQSAFGVDTLQTDGTEAVAHQWVAATDYHNALCIMNDGIYGSSYQNGEITLSLLRSATYCAHPIDDRAIFEDNRFYPRMEQGERLFEFWITGGKKDVLKTIPYRASLHNEKPYALSFFPSGEKGDISEGVIMEGNTVQMSAFKMAENQKGYILRIYECVGVKDEVTIIIPTLNIRHHLSVSPFEVKTLLVDTNSVTETNLLEEIM